MDIKTIPAGLKIKITDDLTNKVQNAQKDLLDATLKV